MSIIVIDYGGSTVGQISHTLAEYKISCVMLEPTDPIPETNVIGIILSGGPDHIYEHGSRRLPDWIDQVNIPVLGICYGMQLIVQYFGGSVVPLATEERGPILVYSVKDDPLLGDFTIRTTWMNHSDTVINIPANLEITSISSNGHVSSLNDQKRWWGVQFHPENIVGLDWGREIFSNFIRICS